MMAHCDAKRAAPRTKAVRPRAPREGEAPETALRAPPPRRPAADAELADAKARTQRAEARLGRLHRLVSFAAEALLLLRDIFNELRLSRQLVASDVPGLRASTKPADTLDKIVQMFASAVPQLAGL